ncbi:unnamed protein product [Closterium sp. Naga37s-1]|nr:unnamed protein product [Closterium sp. Naga37s-1]
MAEPRVAPEAAAVVPVSSGWRGGGQEGGVGGRSRHVCAFCMVILAAGMIPGSMAEPWDAVAVAAVKAASHEYGGGGEEGGYPPQPAITLPSAPPPSQPSSSIGSIAPSGTNSPSFPYHLHHNRKTCNHPIPPSAPHPPSCAVYLYICLLSLNYPPPGPPKPLSYEVLSQAPCHHGMAWGELKLVATGVAGVG